MLHFADLDGAVDATVVTHLSGIFQHGGSVSVTLGNFASAENADILFQSTASHLLADQ